MKKFLSLVLALVMTMSLVTVAGAEGFTDADSVNYDEAVEVMTDLGVVGGYADGSFNPNGTLTRGAAAKIICNIIVGPDVAEDLVANAAPYADVPANHTFAGYIAYCANAGIISGYADGTFRPAATLTGYAFMKMLLGAIGYDAAVEGYTGTNWAINVAQDVATSKLTKGLDGKFNGNKALTREEACLYAFNALLAPEAYYTNKADKITIGDIEFVTGGSEVSYRGWSVYESAVSPFYGILDEMTTAADKIDALGRPARTWKNLDKNEVIGTYAVEADLVIENKYKKDSEVKDLIEDAGLTYANEVKAADTEIGRTIEIFADAKGNITKVVAIEASLLKVQGVQKDLVSTDYDDRYVKVGNKFVEAEAKDNTKVAGVEIDNFEEVYEAAKAAKDDGEELWVLVIFSKDANGADKEIFSIELPEIVTEKVTSVKDDTVVAGGVSYLKKCAVEAAQDKLWVGENGVVYKADKTTADDSDVIYLETMFAPEADKWNKNTYTAQIVNEEFEIVEITTDKAYTKGFYTYTINDDDQYELKSASAKVLGAGVAMDDEDTYVKIPGKTYFAEDMVVVFMGGAADKLEVTVKDGAQTVAAANVLGYVLNSDDDVAIVYVAAAFEGVSEDVVYLTDMVADGTMVDLEGDKADSYTAYIEGNETQIMLSDASKLKAAGFWSYTIDEDTGKYELKAQKSAKYMDLAVKTDAKAGAVVITKDIYVSADIAGTADDLDDVKVAGNIYDLTEEGLYTLADIASWDGEQLKVSFIYDAEEKEIVDLYVDFLA